MSSSEIGFALLLFDPVDLFPFSEVGIVKFLSKRSHPRKGESVSDYDEVMTQHSKRGLEV